MDGAVRIMEQYCDIAQDIISKYETFNTKYTNLYKGQFGLSPIYENNNLNLLYILKQNKLINSLSFGFAFNEIKNNDDDFLFFGEKE